MADRKKRYFNVMGVGQAETPPTLPTTSGVGTLLRQRREAMGHDLATMANHLRIRQTYLAAIEEGRFADLPGPAYVTGFLRTYAHALNLDVTEIQAMYRAEIADKPPDLELYFPEPVNEGRVPGGALLLLASILGLLVYGGWYILSSSDRSLSELMVAALPESLAERTFGNANPTPPSTPVLAPAQVEALVGQSQPTGPEVGAPTANGNEPANSDPASNTPAPVTPLPRPVAGVVAPVGQVSALPPAAAATATPAIGAGDTTEEESELPPIPDVGQSTVPVPASATTASPDDESPVEATATPGPLPPATARVFGVTEGPVRVVVRATDQVWIEVRDEKGTLWASRVLRPGDVFRAPDAPGIAMTTGNAGGVIISIDGTDLPVPGEKGQVMRNIPLSPRALRP